uniref:Lantibiotic dehydratase n=1 Tax=Thermosporothrix sp. COM3 TaxID=2490863 RepID=A0A455SPH6_9CHLR|nr:lantibiotic dehydratase [Thermosporothrix sp. COM3]
MRNSEVPASRKERRALYKPLDGIMVRMPFLPVEAYLEETSVHALDPRVQRALAVGSLDLLDEIERNATDTKSRTQRERKLQRYLIRMTTRPTPYGLFAGAALAQWADRTALSRAAGEPIVRVRPDMEWLMRLIWRLETIKAIRPYLRLQANTAVHVRRGRIFLVEALPSGKAKPEKLVSVRATGVALRALSLTRTPMAYPELVKQLLATTPGATVQQVEGLLAALVQHTFLQTDLRPPLTGRHPALYLLERLREIPPLAPFLHAFEAYLVALQQGEYSSLDIGEYRQLLEQAHEVERVLDAISGQPTEQSEKNLLQVDMALPLAEARLTRAIGEEVAATVETMLRLTPLPEGIPYLKTYLNAFLERYGPWREVPLLELLDPHVGLGLPAPYTKERELPNEEPERFPGRDRALFELALQAFEKRQQVVLLDEPLVERLSTTTLSEERVPHSLDVYVSVVAPSAEAIDAGRYHLVIGPNVGVLQAGRALGRFADLLGDEAVAALRQIARTEEADAPGCIRAELVYLPKENRLANVLTYAPLGRYEICYGTSAGTDQKHVIPLDELVVGVRDNRFYVRWTARNCEILLSIGHMLNPIFAPPLVRFLCDISREQTPMLSRFYWGQAEAFPYLPRVQSGRSVLRLAQWEISASFHLKALQLETPEQFWQSLGRWREQWHVPRYVYTGEMDQRLLLDLERREHVEELRLQLLRKVPDRLILQEGLPGPADAWIEGPEGHYLSEFVVSLGRQRSEPMRPPMLPAFKAHTAIPRLCPPGSDWLFLKLYCAPSLQESLIAQMIRPFAQEALQERLATDWFFLRYLDPDPHVRLRFHGEKETLLQRLLPRVSAWATQLMTDGPCPRFTFDVYEREIERYGGESGILLAEQLFGADSRAVAALLHLQQTRRIPLDRIDLAVLSVDRLLAQLGLTPEQRRQWYRMGVTRRPEAGPGYRLRARQLRELIGNAQGLAHIEHGEHVAAILDAREAELAPIARELAAAEERQELTLPLASLYGSYVHLHCNRLLGTDKDAESLTLQLLLRTHEGLARAPVADSSH